MTKQTNISRIAAIAALLLAGETAMSLEQPQYIVLYKEGDVEIRQYEPYLVAQTIIESADDYNDAGNEGFRRLFRYITGGNRSRAKIEMTAPVEQSGGEKIAMTTPVQQAAARDGWRVAFMLPSAYTLETAPVPSDPRVTVERVPGRLMAVLRYSGRWTARNFERRRSELNSVLEASGLEPTGPIQSALYNPPYTPPFLRRNEVMVPVDRLPAHVRAGDRQVAAQSY